MHAPPDDEDWDKPGRVASWEDSDSLSAWDGGRCVGHAAGYRFDTLVPGGAWLPTSGVTRVGVLSTHRRRGLLRALMTRLLADAAERGQVLASLRASETRIYQRFGFGLAGRSAEATITSRDALPITGSPRPARCACSAHDEILPPSCRLYDRVARRPGVLNRPDWLWQRYLEKAIELGGDAEFVAVHTSADGVDDGFVHYSVKWVEARSTPPRGTGEVYDLWGMTPGGRAGAVGLRLQRRPRRRVVRRGASRRRRRPVRRRRHAGVPARSGSSTSSGCASSTSTPR